MVTQQIVEVAVNTPRAQQLFFRPLARRLRGPADFSNPQTKAEFQLKQVWQEPVPAQVLGINLTTGEKYIREPLHDKEHSTVRNLIERKGYKLPPEREVIEADSIATWVYWLNKEIEAGNMRVIAGTMPQQSDVEGEPRLHFIFTPRESSEAKMAKALDSLTAAVEAQTKMLTAVLAKLK